MRLHIYIALWAAALATGIGRGAERPAGLALTVSTAGGSDSLTSENLWLYTPAGEPPTPFVTAGPFSARWSGFVACDLRSQYRLHAECRGEVKITVGGVVALEGKGRGDEPISSPEGVKFNKGPNELLVEYKSPADGDAYLRVYWSNKETPYNPIPSVQLSHDDSPDLSAAAAVQRGRDLFAEWRCVRCHATTIPAGGMAELAADAPAFGGIGSRRRFGWLAQWIENPQAVRPGAEMPRLFNGPDAHDQAGAAAAFLASLTGSRAPESAGKAADGKDLYDKLHCAACHNPPDGGPGDPGKISQRSAKSKFQPGALAAFLQNPGEHFAWIRMPNFRLTPGEAANLAAYLEANADDAPDQPAPSDAAVLARGHAVVQTAGCLNCHTLDQPGSFKAPALADLAPGHWNQGCLAETPVAGSKAPVFPFSATDRAALRAFGATDRSALSRQTPADFLRRQSGRLNCRECHGKFDGFPAWEILAGKFKPEWAERFIAGQQSAKPRPWLEARMPGFAPQAHLLALGLAEQAGFGPAAAPDPAPPDAAELAKIGQKLAGPNGGFSCNMCHPIAGFPATQVFEAPGVNLADSYNRLQPSYFRRWLRAPTSLDAASKMPVYFDEEGRSPLSDVLGGDGPRTITAVWEYLRLGRNMPKPE